MNTFILMWNPAISSYTWDRFKDDQKEMCEDGWSEGVGNWSVWDHEHADEGDRFFMVKVGEGKTGIVMAGTFVSPPYEDEDWSGHGRRTFYVDLDIEEQVDPDKVDIITTEELYKEMPDFEWKGGHSGRLLDETSAEKLEIMWLKYINKIRCINDEGAVFMQNFPCLNTNLKKYFRKTKGETCEICGYNYKKVFGKNCKQYVEHEIFLNDDESEKPMTDEEFISRIHCVCDSCRQVDSDMIYRKLNK